jgi:hypothetical protein
MVVDSLYSLDHCNGLPFHLLTLSIVINVAVHTTQNEKNIRVGLKIDCENKIKSCMIYPTEKGCVSLVLYNKMNLYMDCLNSNKTYTICYHQNSIE